MSTPWYGWLTTLNLGSAGGAREQNSGVQGRFYQGRGGEEYSRLRKEVQGEDRGGWRSSSDVKGAAADGVSASDVLPPMQPAQPDLSPLLPNRPSTKTEHHSPGESREVDGGKRRVTRSNTLHIRRQVALAIDRESTLHTAGHLFLVFGDFSCVLLPAPESHCCQLRPGLSGSLGLWVSWSRKEWSVVRRERKTIPTRSVLVG